MKPQIIAAALTASSLGLAMPAAAAPLADVAPVATATFEATPATTLAWSDMTAEHKKRKHHGRDRHYDDDDYYGRTSYGEPVYRDTRVWRGRDGNYRCEKRDGTTGLIIGGAVGALLGREIDRRGDRTLGTVLGAAGGALLGKELTGGTRCR